MNTMSRQMQIIVGVVAALVLFGGGYAVGMTIGRGSEAAKEAAASPSASGGRGQFVTGTGGAGAAITVEVRTGGGQGASPTVTSQIVLVGTSTRIVKTTETDIKASDLKANDQIQIVGTTDATGNVAATAIIVGGNALQQLFGGGAGGPGGAGASGRPSPTPTPTR
jgi:hypothetical protein